MKTLHKIALTAALLVGGVATAEIVERRNDEEAVRAACMDYVEGIYSSESSRVDRSVAADLVKRGYYKKRGSNEYTYEPMTREQLMKIADTFSKNVKIPADAVKEVVVFDVSDQTASAKITAVWGIDYVHLAKVDGKWKMVNVLWQSPPPKAP